MEYNKLIIGRKGQQTQSLTDITISSQHAELNMTKKNEYIISLLNIENNLWINGLSVVTEVIKPSDDIRLGDKKIKLDIVGAINDFRIINGLPPIKSDLTKSNDSKYGNAGSSVKPDKVVQAGKFSEIIPPVKPIEEPDIKDNNDKPKEHENGYKTVTPEQLENLRTIYNEYAAFKKAESMYSILAKLANGLPILVLLALRMGTGGKISWLILCIVFIALQAVAIYGQQKQVQISQTRTVKRLHMLRKQYRCPMEPDKPLFYEQSNIPIPFDELSAGSKCGKGCRICKLNIND